MRRILPWLALCLLFAATPALAAKPTRAVKSTPPPATSPATSQAASQALDTRIEGVRFLRLENGLGVLVKEDDRFPLVHVRLLVHAGSAYENGPQAGISHVLEHMVFKGAGDMRPGEAALRIEAAGGSLNASTSFDETVYHVEVPDAAWRMGLRVVADMALKPALIPAELESEKEVILAELKRGEDTPDSMLFETLQGMVFAGTGYQHPIIGFRDTVRAATSQSIRAYIAPLYQPQNMILCVVGKVKAEDVLAQAREVFGSAANTATSTPPVPYALKTSGGPRVSVVPGMWNKVHVGLAFPAPDFRSADMPGLDLLAQTLGGDETGRLYRRFKYELRLVDTISAGMSNLERGGIMMISAVLDLDKLPRFFDELSRELAGFDPAKLSDQELARGRTNIEAQIFLARETIGGLASKLLHQYAYEGGQQGEANYLAQLRAADRAQLADLYRRYFRPEALSVAVLAPKDATIDAGALRATLDRRWPAKAQAKAETAGAAATAPREIRMPGGSTLVLLPDATLPYASVSLAWSGGDALLQPAEQGLGALTASLLPRGTRTRSANQVEDFLADHAASLAASSGTEGFSLGAKFPSRFAPDMFSLLREVLEHPALAESELARAREDQLNAIKRGEDQPFGLAFRHLPGLLFDSAPHDYLRLGRPEAVAAFTRAQAADYWKRQSARPFVLAVCGTFDADAVTAFATALDKALVRGGENAPAIPAPHWKAKAEAGLKLPGRNQSHLFVIFKAPGRADQEASARLSLLRAALAGQSGLLFRDMRDRQGLGYTVTAFLWQLKDAGFLAFYIGSDPDKLPQAMEGFRKAAAALAATPLPEAEMARARNILSGDYYQDRQAILARSREAASSLAQGLPRDAERALVERAQALSAEDVRREAAAVLKWDEAYVLKVEP